MKRQSVFTVLVIVAVATAAFAITERALGRNTNCERCGTRMGAFMEGDPEREDTDILQCPQCGFMLNTRHRLH